MGMTLSEKILAAHAGRHVLRPGQIVEARADLLMANDITAPLAIDAFKDTGALKVFDPDRVVLIADHFTPNKDLATARQVRKMLDFAAAQMLTHRFEGGRAGVEHVLLPEQGLALPGEIIAGADSHTSTMGACGAWAVGVGSTDIGAAMATGKVWFKVPATLRVELTGSLGPWSSAKDLALEMLRRLGPDGADYLALEFHGPLAGRLSMSQRQCLANMAVEAGAKTGIFGVDDITRDYLADRARRPWQAVAPDPDAVYHDTITINADGLGPLIARPHSPYDVAPAGESSREAINQVFIGSCTNGRLDDLRQAAAVLQGRQVHSRVRLIVLPATPAIYRQALKEGVLETIVEAGGQVGPPSCGPCLGGHLGVLAPGEVAVATSNRNFIGRMGHRTSRVYLAGPMVAAASAVLGRVASPEEL